MKARSQRSDGSPSEGAWANTLPDAPRKQVTKKTRTPELQDLMPEAKGGFEKNSRPRADNPEVFPRIIP
jgi:hypothetical protein